jgi:lipopolysaccharide export system ATP-binding protein
MAAAGDRADKRPVIVSCDESSAMTPEPAAPAARPAEPEAGLAVVGIGKTLGGRKVLDGVSLSVAPGEIVALLGPDGAGKTVCLLSIVGLIRPDEGRILLDGIDVTRLPMYRRARLGLGYLPEEPSVFRGLTVEQNLRAVLEVHERDPAVRRQRLDALLQTFKLDHLRRARGNSLSGGEQRRCEIARAVAANPSVMLLDGPFAGIDPLTVAAVRTMVLDLSRRGVGVLISDYHVAELFEIVDRACILHDGRLLRQGRPAELAADPSVQRLFLGNGFRPNGRHGAVHSGASPRAGLR